MKKNVLFIIPGLGAGGGEKSLINLLTQFDYSEYNVDLFLLNKEGIFIEFLPKEVNILEPSKELEAFTKPLIKSLIYFLKNFKFNLAYNRIIFTLRNKLTKNKGKAEQYSWNNIKESIGIIDKVYDVAIGYLEKTSNYICVDCVQAKTKIGWIHNDYNKLNLDKDFDEYYFEKLNYIVTVSDKCEDVLKNLFKQHKSKIKLIHNIVSVKAINELGSRELKEEIFEADKINILSIGRLDKQKGFDMAIEACRLLVNKGYKINWNVIGEGKERKHLEVLIDKYNLRKNFKLLGLRNNPYPYIKSCDIYAQPSRFEGKSVAIDEAKILCKPILVTNFSTVNDQIKDGEEGIITEMTPTGISEGIELITDKNIKSKLTNKLNLLNLGNENEIDNLYKLLN